MILLTRLKRQKRRKRQQDIPEFCKFSINFRRIGKDSRIVIICSAVELKLKKKRLESALYIHQIICMQRTDRDEFFTKINWIIITLDLHSGKHLKLILFSKEILVEGNIIHGTQKFKNIQKIIHGTYLDRFVIFSLNLSKVFLTKNI